MRKRNQDSDFDQTDQEIITAVIKSKRNKFVSHALWFNKKMKEKQCEKSDTFNRHQAISQLIVCPGKNVVQPMHLTNYCS